MRYLSSQERRARWDRFNAAISADTVAGDAEVKRSKAAVEANARAIAVAQLNGYGEDTARDEQAKLLVELTSITNERLREYIKGIPPEVVEDIDAMLIEEAMAGHPQTMAWRRWRGLRGLWENKEELP